MKNIGIVCYGYAYKISRNTSSKLGNSYVKYFLVIFTAEEMIETETMIKHRPNNKTVCTFNMDTSAAVEYSVVQKRFYSG